MSNFINLFYRYWIDIFWNKLLNLKCLTENIEKEILINVLNKKEKKNTVECIVWPKYRYNFKKYNSENWPWHTWKYIAFYIKNFLWRFKIFINNDFEFFEVLSSLYNHMRNYDFIGQKGTLLWLTLLLISKRLVFDYNEQKEQHHQHEFFYLCIFFKSKIKLWW